MKTVLVTGGTGVLGRALVRELCRAGFHVTANFRFNLILATALSNETGCQIFQADVTDEAAVENLFKSRKFEAVVHLAGENRNDLLVRTSIAGWNEILKSQLEAAFLVTRESLRTLPRGGQLLLVASRVGERGYSGQCAYAAAKAGVLGLMRTAALEAKAKNIAVNALCPGFAPAPSSGFISLELLQARQNENWLPDAEAPQSFAAFVTWFLTQPPHISGQILRPDCRI